MNIGDRVKIVHSAYEGDDLQAGKTGVIASYDPACDEYKVKLDNPVNPVYNRFDWEFDAEELEVIA